MLCNRNHVKPNEQRGKYPEFVIMSCMRHKRGNQCVFGLECGRLQWEIERARERERESSIHFTTMWHVLEFAYWLRVSGREVCHFLGKCYQLPLASLERAAIVVAARARNSHFTDDISVVVARRRPYRENVQSPIAACRPIERGPSIYVRNAQTTRCVHSCHLTFVLASTDCSQRPSVCVWVWVCEKV